MPPDTIPHRPRSGWSGCCPFCRSSALAPTKTGALECAVCTHVLAVPSPRTPAPALPDGCSMPRWDDDVRLFDGTWERYSRQGGLLAAWGTSTRRKPGETPPLGVEQHAPAVQAEAQRGRADDQLDAAIAAYVAEGAEIADAVRAMRAGAVKATRAKVVRRANARQAELLAIVLGEELLAAPPSLPKGSKGPPPVWYLNAAPVLARALHSQLEALALLLGNALLRRGIDVWDLLGKRVKGGNGAGGNGASADPDAEDAPTADDPVTPRLPRSTPLASYGHALALALNGGGLLMRGGAGLGGGAQAKHPLPQGLVFNVAACHPSRSGGGEAPGEDGVNDGLTAWAALRAARARDGAQLGGEALELLALVDGQGLKPGQASRARGTGTARQVSIAVREAREGFEDALRARALIPPARARRSRSPTFDPFAGVGAAS